VVALDRLDLEAIALPLPTLSAFGMNLHAATMREAGGR